MVSLTHVESLGVLLIIAVVYSFAEKSVDKHWIKIRDVIRDYRKEISTKHWEKMNMHYDLLHSLGTIPKILAALITSSALFLMGTPDYFSLVLGLLIFLNINWLMDMWLNHTMDWGIFHRGSGVMDKIPFWGRGLLLLALIITFILT